MNLVSVFFSFSYVYFLLSFHRSKRKIKEKKINRTRAIKKKENFKFIWFVIYNVIIIIRRQPHIFRNEFVLLFSRLSNDEYVNAAEEIWNSLLRFLLLFFVLLVVRCILVLSCCCVCEMRLSEVMDEVEWCKSKWAKVTEARTEQNREEEEPIRKSRAEENCETFTRRLPHNTEETYILIIIKRSVFRIWSQRKPTQHSFFSSSYFLDNLFIFNERISSPVFCVVFNFH